VKRTALVSGSRVRVSAAAGAAATAKRIHPTARVATGRA
jgi:hypothetical protein